MTKYLSRMWNGTRWEYKIKFVTSWIHFLKVDTEGEGVTGQDEINQWLNLVLLDLTKDYISTFMWLFKHTDLWTQEDLGNIQMSANSSCAIP